MRYWNAADKPTSRASKAEPGISLAWRASYNHRNSEQIVRRTAWAPSSRSHPKTEHPKPQQSSNICPILPTICCVSLWSASTGSVWVLRDVTIALFGVTAQRSERQITRVCKQLPDSRRWVWGGGLWYCFSGLSSLPRRRVSPFANCFDLLRGLYDTSGRPLSRVLCRSHHSLCRGWLAQSLGGMLWYSTHDLCIPCTSWIR